MGDEAKNPEGEDRAGFLIYMRRVLRWKPEDRAIALELLRILGCQRVIEPLV